MKFTIDTGGNAPAIVAKSVMIDTTQAVDFSDPKRAERTQRQIIGNIEAHEDADTLDAYMAEESVILDAIFMMWPNYSENIRESYEFRRAVLRHGDTPYRAPIPAPVTGAPVCTQSPSPKGNRKMFSIDTGNTGGSIGPWITWTSEGSARKGLSPESWVLRYKNENDAEWRSDAVEAFKAGCVLDLDSLQLGWEKDGGTGVAPERRWNPSIAQATPRPDDAKKPGGGYVWGKALSVRCAIGGGKAATWEQASFGAYEAFDRLTKQIMAEYPGDNTLPLVKQTGVDRKKLPNGATSIPVLEIVKWVPRPDCLKDAPPVIATAAAEPAPAPVTRTPIVSPAPVAQAPVAQADDMEF